MNWVFSEDMHTEIKNKAFELGFDLCGIAPVRSLKEYRDILDYWIDRGFHAGMLYMEGNIEKRIDPALLVENAQSVIVTGMNYYSKYTPGENQPVFARYALGQDYHHVIKDRLYIFIIAAFLSLYPAFLDYYSYTIAHIPFVLGDFMALFGIYAIITFKRKWLGFLTALILFVFSMASYPPKIAFIAALIIIISIQKLLNASGPDAENRFFKKRLTSFYLPATGALLLGAVLYTG